MSQLSNVQTVEKQSIQDKDGGANTVTQVANSKPTENGKRYVPSNVTQEHFYRPNGFTRNCNHCGREYTAKRSTSKFCSGTCRKYAFDVRQAV